MRTRFIRSSLEKASTVGMCSYENSIRSANYFLPFLFALSNAMATACFCGLPDLTSSEIFSEIIFFDFPFLSGIIRLLESVAQVLGRDDGVAGHGLLLALPVDAIIAQV
jgi:hypothetical protein